jgi:uncharacterized glyoxalase superfamily protein PhnB
MTGRGSPLSFKPDGWPTVIPRIVAVDAERLVSFVKLVFGGTGDYSPNRPAEIAIGGSLLLISDAGTRRPMPAFLYVYVEDVDATFRRAIEAGARSLEEPADLEYGDRRGMVEDRWGNTWQIATRVRT